MALVEWGMLLVDSYHAMDGVDQLCGIERRATFEYVLYVSDIGDTAGGVAFDYDQIGVFTGSNDADSIRLRQVLSGVQGVDADGLFGRESGFDQQFEIALIAVAG